MKRAWLLIMVIAALALAACTPDGAASTETDAAADTGADTEEVVEEAPDVPAAEAAETTEEAAEEVTEEATEEPSEEAAAEPAADETASDEVADDAATDADSSAAGLRTFTIVPEESNAAYLVDETFLSGALDRLGITPGDYDVRGTTGAIEGQLQLNFDDPAAALGENRFAVNLSSLETDQTRRDRWVLENPDGPQFGQFTTAEFVATEISATPEGYAEGESISFQMTGDMTIRDVTQPLTFDVVATLEGDTITGTAAAPSLLSDWGINPPVFAGTLEVEDPFIIEVAFTAVE